MGIFENKIIEAIDEIVKNRISQQAKYNTTLRGKIIQNVSGNIYEVEIKGDTHQAKAINGVTYVANDIVYVLLVNNNFSEKIILSLVP